MENLVLKALKKPSKAVKKVKRICDHTWEDWLKSKQQLSQETTIINKKEIRVLGLMRSGNHAIINWLQSQAKGEVWHLNNLIPKENPYRYKYEHLKDFYYPKYRCTGELYHREAQGDFTSKDCLIYSYEDYAINQVANDYFEQKHDLYLGKSQARYDVIIIRDPFNLLASRIKKNYLTVKAKNKTVIELWLEYAQEYLGETQYLKNQKITINYNQWFRDITYRQQIAAKLQLEFTDAGINTVHGCGGGSSFEGRELNGKGNQMDVENRWQYYQENQLYRTLLANPQLWEYSAKIFGHIPGTECLK